MSSAPPINESTQPDQAERETAQGGIGAKTLRGVIWAYGSFVGGRLLILGSTAVLARLLSPGTFGIVGFALAFLAFIDTFQSLGLTQALVAYRGDDLLERANTVFVATVGIGLAMWLLSFALAPVAASFFHQPEVVRLMPVLGVNFLLRAIGSTHYALAQRWLDFRSRAGAEFADVIVRGAAGIALAVAGAGVWSIALGYVVGTAAMTVALWIRVPWRPRLRPRRAHLEGLIGFGSMLALIDVISAIVTNVDYVFVGRILGATALGLYTIGYRLPELIIINLSVVAGMAMFPAFAQLDRHVLRHAYLVGFRYTMMVSLPITAGMVLLARPLVLTLFGHKWEPAVGPMQTLALFALAVTIDIPAGTVYKAVGKAHVLLRLAVPKVILLIVGLVLFTHDGIVAAALCQTVLALAFAGLGIGLVWRMLGAGPAMLWREVWPVALSASLMAVVIVGLRSLIASPALELIVCVPIGAAVYVLTFAWLAPHAMRDVLAKLMPRRFDRSAAEAVEPREDFGGRGTVGDRALSGSSTSSR